jgi:pSer/pThr/pTyr-binding forkhead associated (FHA) protein
MSFCGHCGSSLPGDQAGSPNDQASLAAIEGPLAGQAMTIPTKGLIIGRGSACDLRLLDVGASRQHAHIRYAQGSWYIQDLGSSGGTFINDEKVRAIRLNSGDRISIGESTWTFHIAGQDAAEEETKATAEVSAGPETTPSAALWRRFPLWLWIVHGAALLVFAGLVTLVAISIKNGLLGNLSGSPGEEASEETQSAPEEIEEGSETEPQGRLRFGPMIQQTPVPGPGYACLLPPHLQV